MIRSRSRARGGSGAMVAPAGYAFLVSADGYYLMSADGYYLIAKI